MRMSARAAAVVAVVTTSTLALPAATAGAASTPRGKLTVCNESTHLEIENVYAEGPSWRSAGSLSDECTDWARVRVGNYNVGFSLEDLMDEFEDCPGPDCNERMQFRVSVKVYRNGNVTKKTLVSNGLINVATRVAKNRTTAVVFNVRALNF